MQSGSSALLEAARGLTFKACAEQYVTAHVAAWQNEKHRAQWSSTLEAYAHPVIGELAVAAIDHALVLKVLQPIWRAGRKQRSGSAAGSKIFWRGRRCATSGPATIRRGGAAISISYCRRRARCAR